MLQSNLTFCHAHSPSGKTSRNNVQNVVSKSVQLIGIGPVLDQEVVARFVVATCRPRQRIFPEVAQP
ncbi:unnamed protein product [Larinioides sclopetarius]|uniref:Uncharacterized protein n=1 Tax=Larinioides sclopetarius TaxID=280406 RepID=A0AAV2ACW8_9ARAC